MRMATRSAVRRGCDPAIRRETDHGAITAGFVVEATHLPFSDSGGFFARTYPMRSYALSARLDGPVPQGMYLSVDTPSRSVRSARMDGEEVVILGGESHKVGQDPDTRERYAALEGWARSEFPIRSIDYRWSAQDFVPVDHVPFVGRVSPASERVLVATGFKKWGMTTGTAAGLILTDYILERPNPWSEVFDAVATLYPFRVDGQPELVAADRDPGRDAGRRPRATHRGG